MSKSYNFWLGENFSDSPWRHAQGNFKELGQRSGQKLRAKASKITVAPRQIAIWANRGKFLELQRGNEKF